jgi:hypothetical protein
MFEMVTTTTTCQKPFQAAAISNDAHQSLNIVLIDLLRMRYKPQEVAPLKAHRSRSLIASILDVQKSPSDKLQP